MFPAGSVQSNTNSIASYVMKMAHSRPGVEIIIDGHTTEKTYTTFDAITGVANITLPQHVRFNKVRIILEGQSKTFVEKFSAGTRSKSVVCHRFLKLVMPMRDFDYPQPRVTEAGRTYTFTFNFNIPDQLLPGSCEHKVESEHVKQAHLQLPPTLADKDLTSLGDLSPDMSRITYVVKAEVLRYREVDGQDDVLVKGAKELRVIPAVAEAPPMSLVDDDPEYVLSKMKTLRKGFFSGTLGRLVVSAAQTNALTPQPGSSTTTSPTTMATLYLRFYPQSVSSEPPKVGGVTTKIKASTFFAIKPMQALPSISSQSNQLEGSRRVYSIAVPLSSRCMESVSWSKHEPHSECQRRDSNSTATSRSSGSNLIPEQNEDVLYYTAKILVPITLPTSKIWVPTFHSCVISRTYILDLSLTIHTPGAGVPPSSVALHLPVQIASAGNSAGRSQLTAAEAAAELASADEYFVPRVIKVPNKRLIENSVLRPAAGPLARGLPPSYNDCTALRRNRS